MTGLHRASPKLVKLPDVCEAGRFSREGLGFGIRGILRLYRDYVRVLLGLYRDYIRGI